MRRNRIAAGLLAAALLAAGLAPAAAAQSPLSPLGWLGAIGRSVAAWWTALAGDEGERVFPADEVSPHWDPNGSEEPAPTNSDGTQASPTDDPAGNEVSPHWDPDG